MPYFKCPTCTARAYSAAPESRCPSCETALRREHQLGTFKPPTARFRPSISARAKAPTDPAPRWA